MRKLFLVLAAAALLVSCGPKETHLPRNTKSGVDTEAFDKLFSDIALSGSTNELHGIVVLKDGAVIYERYDEGHGPELKHALWSASKTFTATAVGLAADEGLLSVDDPVIKFFGPDELPAQPSDSLKAMKVWNLLTMSSGFMHDKLGETEALTLKDPTRFMLHDTFRFYPGETFVYNSMNTYLLSVIVSKVTGKKLVDYLAEKLFTPMGITDYYWKESAEGYNMGGWGLFLRTEDLAKMGQLFLNKGQWNGKQLVSEKWISEAMSAQIMQPRPPAGRPGNEDWLAGYGYQMWCNANGSYRLDGAWGQFSIIAPEKNAVIAVNSVCGNAQAFLRYIFKDVYDKL
ncbi:MAG: serine hydrolase [Bacteroidales bacterium]|nr:serine hydrolase [Bacteroidales bacterium]MBR6280336.1 serine hydrolase [Bacteroidales bacterium]